MWLLKARPIAAKASTGRGTKAVYHKEGIDPEQGNCNQTRMLGAQALVDWLATDPTGSGSDNILIMGDLNSYDKEDPVTAILAGGYTDLVAKYGGEYAYSYVFDGQLGYLDHGLASPSILSKVTGATIWHVNADEPDLIDYDMTYKKDAQDLLYAPDAYRSSDHDPFIIYLDFYPYVYLPFISNAPEAGR